MHNEEPCDFYPSSLSIREIKKQECEMVRTWGTREGGGGGRRNAYKRFGGNPGGKRLLGKTGLKLEDNIKMNIKDMR